MQRNIITQILQLAASYSDRWPQATAEAVVTLAATRVELDPEELDELLKLLPSDEGRSAKQRISETAAEYWQYLHDNTSFNTNVPFCRSLCAVEESWR